MLINLSDLKGSKFIKVIFNTASPIENVTKEVHKHVLSFYYVNNTMMVTVLLPAGPIKKLT